MKIQSLILLAALTMVIPNASATEKAANSQTTNQASEIAILKAQLDTTRQMQDSFLSMAQWTLGSAIVVALALAVFGWHTNKINYDRDREAIQSESKSVRESLNIAVREGLHESSLSLENTLSKRQNEIQQAVERVLQGKINALSSTISSVKDDVLGIQAEFIEKEANDAVDKKRFGWAVYQYGLLLDIYVKRNTDHYEASDVLDKLFKIVRTPSISLDADTVNKIVTTLQRLPKSHHAACEPLISELKECLG